MIKTSHQTFATILVILGFMTVSSGQRSIKLEDPPWIKEVARARIFYSVPGMARVKPRRNLTYKRVGDTELKLDVYEPVNFRRSTRRPAIIFVHGGALPPNLLTKPKEWGAYVSLAQLAAASGFVGITFNHRFHGWDNDSFANSQADVIDAIKYVEDNAAQLGVDPGHISLWTLSAGSVVVGPAINSGALSVRCVVFYYPIMDLEPLRKDRPVITDEALRKFSLVRVVKDRASLLVPMFIARAGREEAGLNEALDDFVREALLKKATIDLSNHAEGQHGFDVLDNNDRTREIIKRTLEFVKAHG